MALKARITTDAFAKLPPHLQSEYTPKDGRYVLAVDPDEGWALEDVGGLKGALAEEREARRKAAADLKHFEGLDPKAAREALDRMQRLAADPTTDATVRAQIEARERVLADKLTKETEAERARVDKYRKQLEKSLVSAELARALADAKGNPLLLEPALKPFIRTLEDPSSGELIVRVVDAKGVERVSSKAGSRDPMSIEELVNEIKADTRFQPAFSAGAATGGGFTPPSGNQGGAVSISSQEAQDPRVYQAAKARAEKAGVPLSLV